VGLVGTSESSHRNLGVARADDALGDIEVLWLVPI
jgi:hypothetical protein